MRLKALTTPTVAKIVNRMPKGANISSVSTPGMPSLDSQTLNNKIATKLEMASENIMALYIHSDGGEEQDLSPINGSSFSKEEIAQKLSGDPQVIPLRKDARKVIIADKAGVAKELAPNVKASILAGRVVVGPIIVCASDEHDL